MATAFKEIIKQLELQQAAIGKALAALREVEGLEAPAAAKTEAPKATTKGRKRSRLSAEGRARLVAALKARWAAKKAAESGSGGGKKATGKKRGRPKKTA